MQPMTVTEDTIQVMIGGMPMVAPKGSIYFEQIKQAIRRGASDQELKGLFDAAGAVKTFTQGDFQIVDGNILYLGEEVPTCISERILFLMRERMPYAYMQNFWKRLTANTSRRAQQELYKFLEHKGMCITETGMVRAYKAITNSWFDKYSGTFSNHIGAAPKMPRNAVCDDADIGCSYGFHVGSLEYVRGFASGYGSKGGDRIVIVEFDPADAVSVPKDCSYNKIRVCKYRVIEEFRGELPQFENFSATGEDADALTFWAVDEDEDGDDVVTITTDELDFVKADAYDEGRADASSDLTEEEREEIRAEAKAEAKAEAEAEIAARIRRIADSL